MSSPVKLFSHVAIGNNQVPGTDFLPKQRARYNRGGLAPVSSDPPLLTPPTARVKAAQETETGSGSERSLGPW